MWRNLVKTPFRSITWIGLVVVFGFGSIDIATAQSDTITIIPTSLTFCVTSNTSSSPPSQIMVVNATRQMVAYNAVASPGWIRLNGAGGGQTIFGNTFLSPNISVQIDPSGYASGNTATGIIQVSSPPTLKNANVIVSVSSSCTSASPLNASSTAINLTPGTPSQALTIVGGTNGQVVTASVDYGTGPSGWFTLTSTTGPTSGTLPWSLTVTSNVSSSGVTYAGSITFTQDGTTNSVTVPVSFTAGGVSTLTITPAQLNFSYQLGTAAPPAQTINVTSPDGTSINFTASGTTTTCGNDWMFVSPTQTTATNGTSPTPITVSINSAGLTTAGNCSGSVVITSSSAANPTTTIPVNLLVSANPILTSSPSSLNFTYQSGAATPQVQTVSLGSSGAALNFTVTVNPSSSGGQDLLTLSQTSGTTPFNLSIGINPSVLALLAAGTYTDNVVINAPNSGNGSVTVPVTVSISGNSTLTAIPASLTLNYQIGQAQPPTQIVTVASTGAAVSFNASASSSNCNNFLSVSPTSGTTAPNMGQSGGQITVSAVFTGLTAPTTCSGTITVSSPGSGASVTIPVTVNVVNTAVINLGTSGIVQTTNGSNAAINVPVSLTATDNTTQISFSATATTNSTGQSWLSVAPQTGSTPVNLAVQLNPAGLSSTVYTGVITINDSRSGSAVPSQTITVTFAVVAQASATPASLIFALPQGGTVANQTITVNNVPNGSIIATSASTSSCGSNWITMSVSGNVVTVGIDGAGLTTAISPCTGQVAITVPGALNSQLNIPVTVNVTKPINLVVSNSNVTFAFAVESSATPQNQTTQLATDNNSVVAYTAAFTAQSVPNLFTVSPGSGNTPTILSIGLNESVLATLGAGTARGTLTISSPNLASVAINVSLSVTLPPPVVIASVVNAATQQPGALSPGELVTIYGTNVGPVTAAGLTLTSSGKVSTNVGDTQLFFDGLAAPLLYVSATQVNAIVPYEMAGRVQTTLTILRGSVTSSGIQLRITDTSPGIFTLDSSGQGQGAVLNQNGTVNGPGAPTPKMSTISIYATGEGQLSPPGATGSVTSTTPPKPIATPITLVFQVPGPNGTTVNVPAAIAYAGEAPGLVSGVLQVNAVVPATVPSGTQTIILTVGANSSPAVVTVEVQ
jgi:uncharacterized protein (TIGR03437 family)